MNRWEKVRTQLLREFYCLYMESHTAWGEHPGNDSISTQEFIREQDYLVEKGLLRKQGGMYQLTASGRDYVEKNLIEREFEPKVQKV